MDNVKFEKVQESIKTMGLFFSILKDAITKYNDDKNEDNLKNLTDKLKLQHDFNQHTLRDLGYKVDNSDKIRRLNDQIRELESQLGKESGVTFQAMCQFNESLETNLRNELKNKFGIKCHPEIVVTSSVKITLKFIEACMPFRKTSTEMMFINSDEELAVKEKECLNSHAIAKESLEFNEKGEIYFNDNNKEHLENVIREIFHEHGSPDDLAFRLDNFNENKESEFTIADVNFNMICLNSHKMFRQALDERY